jgi:glycosyltransferase involved in cell wall biosynthesis
MTCSDDPPLANSVPLVSVAITTFNSERWIQGAIDSVLRQRTTFPIELVIGDDCSKDTTLQIVRSFQQKHPERIRLLEREMNVGIQRNYFETFEQCRGQFIAWLDADDYWTDPAKLSIQVETLTADPTISACCHYVRWITTAGGVRREKYPSISPGRLGMKEILRSNYVPSPSVVFRNGIQRQLPPWYFDLAPTTDWPIWVLASLSGSIVLLDRVMADYVLTPGSSMMGKGEMHWYQTDARFYEHIESIVPPEWRRLVRSEKGRRYESMAYLLRKQGDFTSSRHLAWKAFRAPFLMDRISSKTKTLAASLMREAEWRLLKSSTASS